MTINEKDLIKRTQKKNDLKAFEALVRLHQSRVRAVIYRFTQSVEDLDDISQEAFIKAFRAIKTFKGNSSFSTWLCSIAINTCKDKLRSNKRYQQKVVSIEDKNLNQIISEQDSDIEGHLNLTTEQNLVLKEIKKLPENQQLAIILHDIEEFSYEEIAKISNCPVGTVKSRLFNARKTLKDKLKTHITSITLS
jgi:RNA polymerase sigma-70 factor (ECF subfamily)